MDRPKVHVACVLCRKSKVKCDGKQPECSRCLDKGESCSYNHSPNELSKNLTKRQMERYASQFEVKLQEAMKTASFWKSKFIQLVSKIELDEITQTGSPHMRLHKDISMVGQGTVGDTASHNGQLSMLMETSHCGLYHTDPIGIDSELMHRILFISNRIARQYDVHGVRPFVDRFDCDLWDMACQNPLVNLSEEPLSKVVSLWECTVIFHSCAHSLSLPYYEGLLWNNVLQLMKHILWSRHGSLPSFLSPHVVGNLLIIGRMFGYKRKYGAASSCFAIASRLCDQYKTFLDSTLAYSALCLLFHDSKSVSERHIILNEADHLYYTSMPSVDSYYYEHPKNYYEWDENLDSAYTSTVLLMRLSSLLERSAQDQDISLSIRIFMQVHCAEVFITKNLCPSGMDWVEKCAQAFSRIECEDIKYGIYLLLSGLRVSKFSLHSNVTNCVTEVKKRMESMLSHHVLNYV